MESRKRMQSTTTTGRAKPKTWSEDDARRILDELAASGETVTAFARRRGLVPQRLWWWQKRLTGRRPASPKGDQAKDRAASFLPVILRETTREVAPAAVELGDGVRVELRSLDRTSALWVALVCQALGGAP